MRNLPGVLAGLLPLFLLLGVLPGTAQDSTPRRSAHVAYDAEMSQVGQDCPSQIEVADRNDCLEDVRVQSYKNFDTFYAGLREVLIDQAPNDSNALELDAAERAWEAERTKTCDAVSQTYDLGTVKHPGSTQPSARARCLIQLTRSRMRDLMQLYEPSL